MMAFQPAPKKQLNILVENKVFAGVEARAAKLGLKTSTYANLLFNAAYAVRVGQERETPVDDSELDEQVKLVFCLAGQADAAAIAKATGVKEPLVQKILDGFRQYRRAA